MIKSHVKRVTGLGLGLVLSGGVLAACEAPEAVDASDAPIAELEAPDGPNPGSVAPDAPPAPQRMGEGGEGEGGVAVASASSSAVVYNAALAIAAAHVFAARDAHAAGETEAAAEMFAHPVSEVLLDMEPVFAERGVEPFSQLFLNASEAVFAGETSAQIAARSDAILATIAAASERAPEDGSTPAEIAAGVAVDQIDRASDMYRIAQDSGQYGPYLDGYGFFKAGELAYTQQADAIAARHPEIAERIDMALQVLGRAYPSANQPETLDYEPAELSAASAAAMMAVLNR